MTLCVLVKENCLTRVVWLQFNGKLVLILRCNFSLESFRTQIGQGKRICHMWWLGCSLSWQFPGLKAKDSLPFNDTLDRVLLGSAGSFWPARVTAGTNLPLCLFNR